LDDTQNFLMPYTISHTVVVMPIARLLARRRLLGAVLIGSMVPDFGVFSRWPIARFETHSIPALITFCLPVGLLTYWLFQFLIKPAMAEILPDGPYARWHTFKAPEPIESPRQWLLAAGGILLGAILHLALDGFSHDGGRGVRLFPALDEPWFDIGRHHVVGTRLIQDFGSVIGLIVVFGFLLHGLRRGPEAPVPNRALAPKERYGWMAAYTTAAIIFTMVFYFWLRDGEDPGIYPGIAFIYDAAVAVLRGLAAAVLAVSIALSLRLERLP
jgi:Domain of unknown function (DUF4184)